MNILVIKQTSLGDALHATGHLRAIKRRYPRSHLTLLTAAASADIFRHNPHVDEIIALDLTRIKRDWRRAPAATARHLAGVFARVRARRFALAFDLQGLARSAVFLYAARADAKFVKGNWLGPGLARFRQPELHAIAEMDGVLKLAGIAADAANQDGGAMEIFTDAAARRFVDELLARINPAGRPLLVFSPFSRWPSKDWPAANYAALAGRLNAQFGTQFSGGFCVVFTGAEAARRPIAEIAEALPAAGAEIKAVNLAGQLSLLQFAELVARARLVVSGDSFPMHLACAQNVPVVALFGPTDARKTGPVGAAGRVVRAPNCAMCDRPNCRRRCLDNLPAEAVFNAARALLDPAIPAGRG